MSQASDLRVGDLRCEYHVDPVGLDAAEPRLTWQIHGEGSGVRQTAYELHAWDESGSLWQSGRVASQRSVHVPWAGPRLHSRQRVHWRVRVWLGEDDPTDWSEPACFEMGLLAPSDWQAAWISAAPPHTQGPAPHLRHEFEIERPVAAARLYATAHGLYELWLNGRRVGDRLFTPGWTSYHHQLEYQSYEIEELLRPGRNAIGAILADGWFRGKLGAQSHRNVYGSRLALCVQLELRYRDGTRETVGSSSAWRTSSGPISSADLKDGECYDARKEVLGWSQPGYTDAWSPVREVQTPDATLVGLLGPPVRKQERIAPVAMITTPAGETVLDFGQNLAGVVEMRVEGPAGATVELHHGEALDRDGNFSIAHLQIPALGIEVRQVDRYTLRGGGGETYTPRFSFHGFRYVKVEGYPGTPRPESFCAIALYSDMRATGSFACSNPKLERLHSNIVWSMKSNFLEVPTDCPTRERSGWTGDAQVFAATAAFLMDAAGFFSKWLRDLAADQRADGRVPNVVPDALHARPGEATRAKGPLRYLMERLEGSAGWGDAAVIVPWTLYRSHGDRRLLEAQYPSMKAWVEYARRHARKSHWVRRLHPSYWTDRARRDRQRFIWDTDYHWGEWTEPGFGIVRGFAGLAKRLLFGERRVATAYLAYSAGLLADAAEVLGKEADARDYRRLAESVRAAYAAEFIGADGAMRPRRQAIYARTLALGLAPESLRKAVAGRLVRLVRENRHRIGTGFLTTPFICQVLGDNGYLEDAYALLLNEESPSWLYAIDRGATTLWETWEGIGEDGTPHQSLNHYSKGAIGSWLYTRVAGIEIGAPGYAHVVVRPMPGGGLDWAEASHRSPYGDVAVRWERCGDEFRLDLRIAHNTSAAIHLPDDSDPIAVGSGRHQFRCAMVRDV